MIRVGSCLVGLLACLALPAGAGATFHGRNGQIAWTTFSAGGGGGGGFDQLETVSAHGGAPHVLFSCAQDDAGNLCMNWWNVAYSPAGGHLLWDHPSGSDRRQIIEAAADGTGQHPLVSGSASQGSFSPDGRRVVLIQNPSSTGNPTGTLAIASVADGSVQTVASSLGAYGPKFTPDRRRIVFEHDRAYPQFPTLWSIDPHGRHARRLIANVNDFDISPDGRLIAYVDANSGAVFLARIDGSHRRRVVGSLDGSDSLDAVAFSPDGRQLVFSGQANNNTDGESLYTIGVRGGRVHQVAASGDTRAGTTGLAWQPRR